MSDFNSTRAVRARKPHRCRECGRAIDPGERYWKVAGMWEGDFFTHTDCDHCHAARRIVWDAAPDWWELSYEGQRAAGEWEDVAREDRDPRIWRMVVGNRRQWRRKDGVLMEVPA